MNLVTLKLRQQEFSVPLDEIKRIGLLSEVLALPDAHGVFHGLIEDTDGVLLPIIKNSATDDGYILYEPQWTPQQEKSSYLIGLGCSNTSLNDFDHQKKAPPRLVYELPVTPESPLSSGIIRDEFLVFRIYGFFFALPYSRIIHIDTKKDSEKKPVISLQRQLFQDHSFELMKKQFLYITMESASGHRFSLELDSTQTPRPLQLEINPTHSLVKLYSLVDGIGEPLNPEEESKRIYLLNPDRIYEMSLRKIPQ